MTSAPALVFALCAAVPPALRWWRVRSFGSPATLRLDPVAPTAEHFAQCLARIAERLDERPAPLRVKVVVPECGAAIDLARDGTLVVSVGADPRRRRLDLRRRWIAGHEAPLVFTGRRPATLYFTPASANRFQVDTVLPYAPPRWLAPALAAVATAGALAMHPLPVAAAAGVWAGASAVRLDSPRVRLALRGLLARLRGLRLAV